MAGGSPPPGAALLPALIAVRTLSDDGGGPGFAVRSVAVCGSVPPGTGAPQAAMDGRAQGWALFMIRPQGRGQPLNPHFVLTWIVSERSFYLIPLQLNLGFACDEAFYGNWHILAPNRLQD